MTKKKEVEQPVDQPAEKTLVDLVHESHPSVYEHIRSLEVERMELRKNLQEALDELTRCKKIIDKLLDDSSKNH